MANIKMTAAQIKEDAKRQVLNMMSDFLAANNAECYGSPYENCIAVTVGGQEVWVAFPLTAKQYTDTKVSKAFDPFEAKAEYDDEQEVKRIERESKEKAKADKIARQKKHATKAQAKASNDAE